MTIDAATLAEVVRLLDVYCTGTQVKGDYMRAVAVRATIKIALERIPIPITGEPAEWQRDAAKQISNEWEGKLT